MSRFKLFTLSVPLAACAMNWTEVRKPTVPMVEAKEDLTLSVGKGNMTLQQVQVVFRHGARTPTAWSKARFDDFTNIKPVIWDKEKWISDMPGVDVDYEVKLHDGGDVTCGMCDERVGTVTEGGCKTGQLTLLGKRQLYDVGKWLHQRYSIDENFISTSYRSDEVSVRTSYFRRTILSAVHLLAGLYESGEINEKVRLETKEEVDEDLYPNYGGCARFFNRFRVEYPRDLVFQEQIDTEEFINNLMGIVPGKKRVYATQVCDMIRSRRAHGLDIPQYLLDNEEQLSKVEEKNLEVLFGKGSVSVLKYTIGSFIDTLCTRMTEGNEGVGSHKMFLYSAHDWTILPLLFALDVDIDEWPPFASHVIVELFKREDDGEAFVRLLYNGKPLLLDSDSWGEFLPLKNFLDLVEKYRVKNFHDECGNEEFKPFYI